MRVLLRVLASATVVVALYYLLPLDHLGGLPLPVALAVGVVVLGAVAAYEVRAVLVADYPSVRAIEALSAYVPVFLVLFASCYYFLARAEPASFNVQHLTRTDTLYFTLTVFSSVGFGDINATSQVARGVVMVQIVLNLVLLGLGVRVLTRAVEIGAARRRSGNPSARADAVSGDADGGPPPKQS